jgi:quaternary ammonium compound-resistance protein SugE
MAWMYLLIASVFEITFALCARYADGFTRLWPTLGTIVAGTFGTFFLSLAVRTLPLSTAYAVWTGIGVAGTTLIGLFVFGESRDTWRLLFLLMILVGIVGLRIVSSEGH